MALPVRYNLLSLMARPTSTLSSIGLLALVIAVFAYLEAVTDSAFETMMATGDPNTLIVLNQTAESETVSGLSKDLVNKLDGAPGVVTADGVPVVSREMVAISSAQTNEEGDFTINTSVRGVDFPDACAVRVDRVKIVEGRAFEPGTYEVIVGIAARRLYRDYGLGDEIPLGNRGTRIFKIVGVFDTGGTAADSEVWGYVETLRDVYGRSGYSSARLRVGDPQAARQAIEYIEGPSVALTAKTEKDYFRDLNTNQLATQVLGFAMILIMGTAAAFAVANTMYAAVAGRTREIGMLRAVGFGRSSILISFLLEGFMLSVVGGVIGCLLSLSFNGLQRNILPATFTTVSYTLQITPKIVGTALIAAVAIGVVGSVFPAWRASRLSVVRSLREA